MIECAPQPPPYYASLRRHACLLPLGLALTLLIFSVLAVITHPPERQVRDDAMHTHVDFLLARPDSRIAVRDRRQLPRPPEPVETLSPVMSRVERVKAPQAETLPHVHFEIPDIDLGLAIDMRPAMAKVSVQPDATQMFAVDVPFQSQLKALKDVAPRYPARAERKKIEGQVLAEFLVDASGRVKEESINIIEAHPKGVFENAVKRSLMRSRFEPMHMHARAVVYRARKQYNFVMP